MKRLAYMGGIILTIVIIGGIGYDCFFSGNGLKILEANKAFPNTLNMYSTLGSKTRIKDIKGQNTVIFYLNSKQEDCLERLEDISKIVKLYGLKEMVYILLWEDEIPKESIEKYKISMDINFSLQGKCILSVEKPTAFILDNSLKVTFISGYSYIDLIKKIHEVGGYADLSSEAAGMIMANTINKQSNEPKMDKTLIMFVSSSCRICKEADEKIKNNLSLLGGKYNMISIRPVLEEKQDYDRYLDYDNSLVYFNVFSRKYNLQSYPAFIIVNNRNNKVEKVFTEIKELISFV